MLETARKGKAVRLARVALERLTWLGGDEVGWEHWLLMRRNIEKPEDLAYYVVFCPVGTTLQELMQVVGQRWTIEESFDVTKDEVGLDRYEVRLWVGWYRHITLAMLAQAYLAVARNYAARRSVKKGRSALRELEELIPLTVPGVRRLLWNLVWGKLPAADEVLNWSRWMGTHQATAKRSHYKHRLAPYPE